LYIISLMRSKQFHKTGTLKHVAMAAARKKARILNLAEKHGTPFFLFDASELRKSAAEFKNSFRRYLPSSRFFYAIKTNYHPYILKDVVKLGFGLDASSGRELELALKAGAKEMLFSGPGKTDPELRLAIKHANRLILNIDNFSELSRLAKIGLKKPLRAGVRFFSSQHEAWSKFGIPLSDIARFWQTAKQIKNLQLQGLQFHTSLHRTPDPYVKVISELGKYLRRNFPKERLQEIKFIDIGGGFYPDRLDGYYPTSHTYPWARLPGKKASDKYYITTADPVSQFARDISSVFSRELKPSLKEAELFVEPGRIIATSAMHLVLGVVDVKPNLAITDGGLNMMGWEFGQQFYLPIINLSNFSPREIKFPLYGSLCTPRDFWGTYIYAKKIMPGDVVVIPNQGAYRFALAQSFIKPIPPVLRLD